MQIVTSVSQNICHTTGLKNNLFILTRSAARAASLVGDSQKESLSMLLQNWTLCKQPIYIIKIGVSMAL